MAKRSKTWTRVAWALALLGAAGAAAPASVIVPGWLKYERLERGIVDKMDAYFLAVTSSGREEYLLGEDEVFEVPYMASKLSVEAEPTRLYDRNGRLIGEFLEARGLYVRSPEELPAFLKKAVVATEDGDFYRHAGVHWAAMARAMLMNLKAGRAVQGGSTLTQQLAKVLFTTRERTFSRKAFELFCARKLEEKFTKDQILLLYLNYIYFGHGCYGVECAARHYFGKPAKELELSESAMLAGIIASPNNYSPFVNVELSKARHRTVLKRMAEDGYVPAETVGRTSRDFWEVMEKRLVAPEASIRRMRVNKAPYFVEHVRRVLERDFEPERLLRGGLKVHTTLDLSAQEAAREALSQGLKAERARTKEKRPDGAEVEGALAAVDARDGGILALVGGGAFTLGNQFDRAVDGRRPVGSAVKPFVYSAAFETGRFGPESVFSDAPGSYRSGRGKKWTPKNYGGKYYGEVTLRTALVKSLNTVAVKLLAELDIDSVRSLLSAASGADASAFPRNLTLALGSAGLTPLELAAAYAIFENGGRAVRPYAIARVEDREGRTVEERAPPADEEPVLSSTTARTVRDVLSGVFGPEGTAHHAAAAAGFRENAAGKTGTTDDYRDAWFAGVSEGTAAAVRIGYDDMRTALGPGRSGGAVAAPVWIRFVKAVNRYKPSRGGGFDKPGEK